MAGFVKCNGALTQAAATFASEQLKPRLSKNVAPHSGRVMWVRALKERISGASAHPPELSSVLLGVQCQFAAFCDPVISLGQRVKNVTLQLGS